MDIRSAGGTDTGKKREHNEDNYGVFDYLGLYVVADGMGGHAAGEVASLIAIEKIHEFISATSGEDEVTWPFERDLNHGKTANRLLVATRIANQSVRQSAMDNPDRKGMGSTVVSLLIDGRTASIAHVGDSRAYLFASGGLSRLTGDHSLVEEQVRMGVLSPELAATHPMKNIITRALGVHDDVQVDVQTLVINEGDTFLLCTDGLSCMLTDESIEKILSVPGSDPQACVDELIRQANNNGGSDNITVVLVRAGK